MLSLESDYIKGAHEKYWNDSARSIWNHSRDMEVTDIVNRQEKR